MKTTHEVSGKKFSLQNMGPTTSTTTKLRLLASVTLKVLEPKLKTSNTKSTANNRKKTYGQPFHQEKLVPQALTVKPIEKKVGDWQNIQQNLRGEKMTIN